MGAQVFAVYCIYFLYMTSLRWLHIDIKALTSTTSSSESGKLYDSWPFGVLYPAW